MRALKEVAKVFGVATLAAITTLGAAVAQESLKDATPVYRPFSWTGFYAGINVGDAWSKGDVNIPAYPFPNHTQTDSALIGGVQAGYNYQINNIVVGIEGDVSKSNVSSTSLSGNGGTELYNITEDWRASLRGRLGVALGTTLVYATAGEAWTNYSTQYIPLAGGVQKATGSGWTFGGGIEHAFMPSVLPSIVVGRIEYLYADEGTEHFFHLGPSSVKYQTQEVRTGLSIKF